MYVVGAEVRFGMNWMNVPCSYWTVKLSGRGIVPSIVVRVHWSEPSSLFVIASRRSMRIIPGTQQSATWR